MSDDEGTHQLLLSVREDLTDGRPTVARTHPQDLGQRTARRPENHDASASDGEHLLFDARALGQLALDIFSTSDACLECVERLVQLVRAAAGFHSFVDACALGWLTFRRRACTSASATQPEGEVEVRLVLNVVVPAGTRAAGVVCAVRSLLPRGYSRASLQVRCRQHINQKLP